MVIVLLRFRTVWGILMRRTAGKGAQTVAKWVWVTRPEYYEDAPGHDRADLEPGNGYVPEDWWTCHKDTRAGDLVILYRSSTRKDIAYLIKARSDAYRIDGHPDAEPGWDWGCDYEAMEKFAHPLSIAAMREDPVLREWGALRARFQRRVYRVPDEIWDGLLHRLHVDPGRIEQDSRRVDDLIRTEHEIESDLWAEHHRFARFGFDLEPLARQHWCSNGGRADLVFHDRRAQRIVVVELKRDLVGRNAAAQVLSYRASVTRDFPRRHPPLGLLIGRRIDSEAAGIVDHDEGLQFIGLDDLGVATTGLTHVTSRSRPGDIALT